MVELTILVVNAKRNIRVNSILQHIGIAIQYSLVPPPIVGRSRCFVTANESRHAHCEKIWQ